MVSEVTVNADLRFVAFVDMRFIHDLLVTKSVDVGLKLILTTTSVDARCVQRFVAEQLSQTNQVPRLLQIAMSEGVAQLMGTERNPGDC